ncbi:MAG: SDR family NAD(P)-dependent oxidoreductase [Halofilum sp. (in: g-proteobacteria)]|nr:SDR family NAD(P)-dependent oxidoreductase [Halofilum sp. (in: g-proteobacteria)]
MTTNAADGTTPDLSGRSVLITGAGDGLGAALATACGRAGAEVILLGRTVRKLEAVYDAIVAAGGPEPAIYPLDLEGAAPNDYEELAGRVEGACGRLDALVHNAAVLGEQTPLEFQSPLEWARTLQVNLTGPLLLTQACLPLLRRAERGDIVFVGDERRGAYWGGYGVSKAAAAALAEMLAEELERDTGLQVHRIEPGPMRTGFRARAFPGALAEEAPLPEERAVPAILERLARA